MNFKPTIDETINVLIFKSDYSDLIYNVLSKNKSYNILIKDKIDINETNINFIPDILLTPTFFYGYDSFQLNSCYIKFNCKLKTVILLDRKDASFLAEAFDNNIINFIFLPIDENNILKTFERLSQEIYKEREIELQQSLITLLYEAIEQGPVQVVITDRDGNILYINPKFTETTGWGSEIIGKKMNILNSGYHDKSFFENLWNIILMQREWRGEICNRKKNGTLYWEEASISSIKNLKGEIVFFIKISQDITLRKWATDEIMKSEARYSSLINSTLSPIVIIDEKGNIIETNEPAENLFGYSKEDMLKKSYKNFITKDEEEKIEKRLKEVFHTGVGGISSFKIIVKNGEIKPFNINSVLFKFENRKYLQLFFYEVK